VNIFLSAALLTQMNEGAAGSREKEVEQRAEEVEQRAEEVEQRAEEVVAGPSRQLPLQLHRITFKGRGRGSAMRHLALPPGIGKRRKHTLCVF